MGKPANKDRENRILDAASQLFVHYGFDKTTISDIAREAGVSKGAIYLHFESKDQLFEGLLFREMTAYSMTWIRLIEADPEGGSIARMYKNMLHALKSSAFMSAIFKRDKRILGTYLRKPDNLFRKKDLGSTRYEFVKMMQDAGAIRSDLDPKVTAHIMNILAYGLVGMGEVMDEADIPPTDAIIEGIADMMEKALTPEGGGNKEAGKAIVRQIAESARKKVEDESSPTSEGEAQ